MTGDAAPPRRAADPVVRAMHRSALRWAAPVALVTVAACWVVRGGGGAAGAAIGGAIAVLAFVTGVWAVGLLLDNLPGAAVPGALLIFLAQLSVLVTTVIMLARQPWLDGTAAAAGLLVIGLAYQLGQVLGFLRARTLYVDPDI